MQAAMAGLGEWIMDFEASHPSPQAADAAHTKLTAPIHLWARTGPAHARSLKISAGHPESFELLEVFRQQTAAGADVPALIFNDFLLHSPMTQAFMAHMNLFAGQLHADLRACCQHERTVRVLSLHYSAGLELGALADDAALTGRIQLTVVDRSSESLRDAQHKLSRLLRRRIICERRDPVRYVEEPIRSSDAYHVAYSVSLPDVMQTSDVIALLCGAHHLLRPGGILLMGNATTAAPAWELALRRWLLGWEFELRNEAAWQAIAARTPFGRAGLQCIPEPGGMGLIVRGAKTE
jgi:SAM-dependent methyltransferase